MPYTQKDVIGLTQGFSLRGLCIESHYFMVSWKAVNILNNVWKNAKIIFEDMICAYYILSYGL